MFLHVGSGTNESTMSDFSTRIKSLHILGDFRKLRVVEFEDASTSFHGRKADLVRASSFTGPPRQKKSCMHSKNSLWHQQDSAIETYLAMSSVSAVRLSPSVQKQKLKLELLRGSRLKLESLPVSVVVHEHLVRACCMLFGTATRRTLTRLHRH